MKNLYDHVLSELEGDDEIGKSQKRFLATPRQTGPVTTSPVRSSREGLIKPNLIKAAYDTKNSHWPRIGSITKKARMLDIRTLNRTHFRPSFYSNHSSR